ncbi:trypsin-like peptidase domain-containing protein [Roseibacillus persicicus]|uniref:S1 family peptidase n=1 Tax=Roseibacillus persicicus TaxID=454148 RepID=UPI00398AF08B
MIPSSYFNNIFQILYGEKIGTAFAIEHKGQEYLVTAKHVVEEISDNDEVFIRYEQKWLKLESKLIGHGQNEQDVTVLQVDYSVYSPSDGYRVMSQVPMGTDCYMMGFPEGKRVELPSDEGIFLPMALMRKGIVGGIQDDKYGNKIYLVDVHGNQGFSGGPIIIHPGVFGPSGRKAFDNFGIIGVVANMDRIPSPIFHGMKELDFYSLEQLGYVNAYSIDSALDVIDQSLKA